MRTNAIRLLLAGALWVGVGAWAVPVPPPLPPELAQSLPLIGVDAAHALGFTGRGVAVAVIDNFTPHPDDPCDEFAHGAWVSGVLEAVAPGAEVHRVDVPLDVAREDHTRCFGFSADALIVGLNEALRNAARWNLKVINYSIGGGRFEAPCDGEGGTIAALIRQLVERGVVFVTAAGNQGFTDALGFPECMPETISVGAVYDHDGGAPEQSRVCSDTPALDRVACYSNSAYFLDLLAPGSRIAVNRRLDGIGTSAAAPHVAGTVALMLQAAPELTAAEVRRLLASTGKPVADHRNGLTFPRVDAARAVEAALALRNHAPQVTLTAVPARPTSGGTVTLTAVAHDPDGDALVWVWWVDGERAFGVDGDTLRWERPAPGVHAVLVRVSDGRGGTGEARLDLEVVEGAPALHEALDANGNRVLDDDEAFEAVRLWITREPVGGQVVDDDAVLALIALWIGGRPF